MADNHLCGNSGSPWVVPNRHPHQRRSNQSVRPARSGRSGKGVPRHFKRNPLHSNYANLSGLRTQYPFRKPDAGRCERELHGLRPTAFYFSRFVFGAGKSASRNDLHLHGKRGQRTRSGSRMQLRCGKQFSESDVLRHRHVQRCSSKDHRHPGSDLRCVAIPRLHREWGCRRF